MPTYTDDQKMIREAVRDFVESEVRPKAIPLDEARQCPVEVVRKMAELNLLGIPFGDADGGAGGDFVALTLAVEELARTSGSLAALVAAHTAMVAWPLAKHGQPSLRQAWLPRLLCGEAIGGAVLPESNQGGGAPKVTNDGGRSSLSGEGFPTIGGAVAGLLAVPTGDDVAFVPATGESVARGPLPSPLGLRACGWSEAAFRGTQVPADGVASGARRTFDSAGRTAVAAMAVGLLQGCLDRTRPYVLERRQFGKPLASFDPIRAFVARMAVDLDIGRTLVHRAAQAIDAGEEAGRLAVVAKGFASEAAARGTHGGVQSLGGYGYLTEYEVERFFRDAKACEVLLGRADDLLQGIGREELTG